MKAVVIVMVPFAVTVVVKNVQRITLKIYVIQKSLQVMLGSVSVHAILYAQFQERVMVPSVHWTVIVNREVVRINVAILIAL